MPRITQSVAMGVGAAGALVDVTSDVDMDAGISRSWGRDDEFRDTAPGTFTYVLDNGTGKYTPGNTAGGLTTLVTEGMQVCWQLGTRLVAGKIRGIEPMFPGDESAWAQVRITCDDMLGDLARNDITGTLSGSMVLGSNPYLYWPMNDAAGSFYATEQSGNHQPGFDGNLSNAFLGLLPTFGTAAVTNIGESQMTLTENLTLPTAGYSFQTVTAPAGTFSTINYPTNSMGCWGMWITTTALNAYADVYIRLNGFTHDIIFGLTPAAPNGAFHVQMGSATLSSAVPVVVGVPHYVQIVVTNSGSASITAELFVDGVTQGTCVWVGIVPDGNGLSTNTLRTPSSVKIWNPGTTDSVISHLSHTPTPVGEYLLVTGTEASLIAATVSAANGVTLGTLPANLSTAPVSFGSLTGTSALDALNEVIKTEQGYVYIATSGTLTSPTQVVKVRERTRNPAVDYTFDTILDLQGAVPYVRDLTNMVSVLTTSGPTVTVVLQDTAAAARVGSASTSESILNNAYVDILAWGQDRLNRGKNATLRVSNVTVDAMTTSTDRSASLLAMIPGDHLQITSTPSTQLGFSAWDGLLLGADEHHSTSEHTFAMRLAPIQAATGIYDTDLYANGGNNTISTALTNVAATMLCTSADTVTLFETSAVNYYLQVESEVVKVTACSAPVAGVQTLTITRAQFSTAAAAHAIGVVPEVYADSTGRLNNGPYAF